MPIRAVVEHMIAVTYGITYDTVVTRFRPYETMLGEIVALVTRSAPVAGCRGALKPGGRAIRLTYVRPAGVIQACRHVGRSQGPGAAVRALRWLVPTAAGQSFRDCEPRYVSETDLREAVDRAGFGVL